MRCPTQTAPMPPAQAEALCDLGLEETPETRKADASSTINRSYENTLMRKAAQQSRAEVSASHSLQPAPSEKSPQAQAALAVHYPPS